MSPSIKEISSTELKKKLDSGEGCVLIDVREHSERDICEIGGECIPLKQVLSEVGKIPRDRPVIIYCRSGGRSSKAISDLQSAFGFTNLYNLKGGILSWIDEVDSTLTRY